MKKERRRNSYLPRFGHEQNKREIHEIKAISIKVGIVVREKIGGKFQLLIFVNCYKKA